MPLLVLAASLLAGIVLGARIAPPPFLLPVLALAAAVAAVVLRRRRADWLLCAGCSALLIGAAHYDRHTAQLDASPLFPLTGSSVQITGMVDEEPESHPTWQQLTVAVRELRRGNERWVAPAGRVQVRLPRLPAYRYGDVLALRGRLAPADNFSATFDYRGWLYRRGILATMAYPAAEVEATGAGWAWRTWLLDTRRVLAAALDRQLPEPQGALVKGILLGIRGDIPADLIADFRTTGTTHILAVSGQNLSIAAALVILLGRRVLGRRHPVFALTFFVAVWTYALLVGMPLSVLRAAVMATLMLAATLVGRQNSGLPALLGAAALMALLDPFAPWDLGFQLSFLAMGGILFVTPLLLLAGRRAFRREEIIPEGWGAVLLDAGITGMAAILGATLATLPIVVMNFGQHPFTALPTSIFALPALPVILLAGGLAGIASVLGAATAGLLAAVAGLAARLGATVAYLAATWLITVVQTGADLPLASVKTPVVPQWAAWLYGASLAFVTVTAHRRYGLGLRRGDDTPPVTAHLRRLDPAGSAVIAVAVLAVVLWLGNPAWALSDGRLHLWALALPEGDAVLVRAPGGATMLVDGGPDPATLERELGRILPFWERRITWAVLTAPQRDRIIGLRSVVQRYEVGGLIEGPGQATTAEYEDWQQLVDTRGIPRVRLNEGDSLELEPGTVLEAFAVPPLPRSGTPPGPVALRVGSPVGEVLLLGDGGNGIAATVIARSGERPVRVVKLHPRAPTPALLPALLEALEPGMLVLTGPGDVPAAATGTTPVERTHEQGTVEIVLEREGGWVRSGW